MNLLSPLRVNISSSEIARAGSVKESINNFIELLMNTPLGECVSDPNFGFVFSNMRFEMFDEGEGVIHSSERVVHPNSLYQKKISGTSKNINTFANELKEAIERYEYRLDNISVTMTYAREQRLIYLVVFGVLKESREDYQYKTTIRVWS